MLIGKRVRQLRKDKNMTLTQLSEKSGVQLATLSRIEHQKMTGTIESHISIALALEVDITELYKDIDKEKHKVDFKTPAAASDMFLHNDKSSYQIMTNNVLSKKMMPMLLKIEPGGRTNKEQNKYGSEKFVFVLEGKVTVAVGDQSFELSKHNTLYFDASMEHTMANAGAKTAQVIVVNTPVNL